MANPTELTVRFTANTDGLHNRLRAVQDALDGLGKRAQRSAQSVQQSVSNTISSIVGPASSAAGQAAEALATGVGQGAQRAGQRINQEMGTAFDSLRHLATGLAAGLSLSGLASVSDEAATLTARLKLATKGTEEFNTAQAATFRIAQSTQSGLQPVVELFGRLSMSTQELQLSQQTLLALTETISQASALSGGGAGAEAALIQLSQALAAGTLRGEELNSVLEQAPRLAQAIAAGMGTSIGALKGLAEQGKLSTEEVLRALLDQRDVLANEFATLPETIGGAFTRIRNAFVQWMGTSTQAQTTAQALARALGGVANILPELIEAVLRLGAVWAAHLVMFRAAPAIYQSLITMTGGLAAAQISLSAAFAATASAGGRALLALRTAGSLTLAAFLGWQIGSYLSGQFLEVRLAGVAMVEGLLKLWERLKAYATVAAHGIHAAFVGALNSVREMVAARIADVASLAGSLGITSVAEAASQAAKAVQPMTSAWSEFKTAAEDALKAAARSTASIGSDMSALADDYIQEAQPRKATPPGEAAIRIPAAKVQPPAKPKPSTAAATRTAERASAFSADLELLADSIRRAQEELERLYQDNATGLTDYFARKTQLQQQAIDTAMRMAQAELAVADGTEARARVEVRIAQLQRDRAQIAPLIAREQAQAERELSRTLEDVAAQMAQLQGDTAAVDQLALRRQREDLQRRFASDEAAVIKINVAFDLQSARMALGAVQAEVDRTLQSLRSTEGLVAAQSEAGTIGSISAESQLQAVRARSLEQLQLYAERLAALHEAGGDPAALESLRAVQTEMARIVSTQRSLINDIQGTAGNALTGLFADLATGAKTASEAFRDMATRFIADMAQMAARALAMQAISSIFGLVIPGQGIGQIAARVKHTGGSVEQGSTRSIDAALFLAAPRFHAGGVVGLRQDEVPAILQRGEEVLTRNDPRHTANAASAAGSGTRIVNVLDPSLTQDWLDSPAGEKTILNIIGRNPRRVQSLLA